MQQGRRRGTGTAPLVPRAPAPCIDHLARELAKQLLAGWLRPQQVGVEAQQEGAPRFAPRLRHVAALCKLHAQ